MIVSLIIIMLLAYVFITYNSLIKSFNTVKEAFSTMDIYLKKRWDLIPNLVEVVKGYTQHEQGVFEKVSQLRASTYQNMSIDKKLNLNEQLTEDISKIIIISEEYPELKASESFLELSKRLTKIEDEIANSRKYYNGTVRIYNNKVKMFPSNIIAKIFKFKQANMFEAYSEEKNNVKVDL